jgi:hypothetical protein
VEVYVLLSVVASLQFSSLSVRHHAAGERGNAPALLPEEENN